MRNIESMVFFIVHMMHLMGTDQGNRPGSIPHNWDFETVVDGGDLTFEAVTTKP